MKILFLLLIIIPLNIFGQNFKYESKDTLNGSPINTISFSGYVNSIYFYDFVGYKGQYPALNIVSIPVGNVLKEPSTNFVVFQTRLRFNSEHQTKIGAIKVFVEGDFINSANAFRIRHALISINKWEFGQTWSSFADESAWPNMTDYDGPPTGIWARPTMIRYNAFTKKNHSLSFSIEGPSLDYLTHNSIDTIVETTYQDIPDVATRYRYEKNGFHIQIGGIYRNIKYKNVLDSSFNYKTGYGISLTTGIPISQNDRLHAQFTLGRGISRYLVGIGGYSWDAVPDGSGNISLVPLIGGFIGYDHYWDANKKFSSSIVGGYIKIKNEALPTPGDLMTGYWGLINLYWHPVKSLDIALEYVAAYRENTLNESGDGARIQFMVQYNF